MAATGARRQRRGPVAPARLVGDGWPLSLAAIKHPGYEDSPPCPVCGQFNCTGLEGQEEPIMADEDTTLEDHNVDELREMAKEAEVQGYSSMNKGELVAALSDDTDDTDGDDEPRGAEPTTGTGDDDDLPPGVDPPGTGDNAAASTLTGVRAEDAPPIESVGAAPSPRGRPHATLVAREPDSNEYEELDDITDAFEQDEGNTNFVTAKVDVFQDAPAPRSKRTVRRLVYRAGQRLPLAQVRSFQRSVQPDDEADED